MSQAALKITGFVLIVIAFGLFVRGDVLLFDQRRPALALACFLGFLALGAVGALMLVAGTFI